MHFLFLSLFLVLLFCTNESNATSIEATNLLCDETLDHMTRPSTSSRKKREIALEKENIPPKDKVNSSPVKREKHNYKLTICNQVTFDSFEKVKPKMLIAKKGVTVVFVDLDLTTVRPKYLLHNFCPEEQEEIMAKYRILF